MIGLALSLVLLAQDGHAVSSSAVLQPAAPPEETVPGVVPVPEIPEPVVSPRIDVGDFTQPYVCCGECDAPAGPCPAETEMDTPALPVTVDKPRFGPSPRPD